MNGSDFQISYRFSADQVLVDDPVDIRHAVVAVPDAVRVDDDDRTLGASVQTPCLINPHLPCSVKAQFPATLFGVVSHRARIVVLATGLIVPLVDAEENVALVVWHQILEHGRQSAAILPAHWYREWDSNPHGGLPHRILSPARLPIPPPRPSGPNASYTLMAVLHPVLLYNPVIGATGQARPGPRVQA